MSHPRKNVWFFVLALITLSTLLSTSIIYVYHDTFESSKSLYVRSASVYEGHIDRRFWITEEAIEGSAESFIGKPVLLAHVKGDPYMSVGVIIKADIRYDDEYEAHYLETIFKILDVGAIKRIKQGLFGSLSISFDLVKVTCTLDATDMNTCIHDPGYRYRKNGRYVFARGIVWEMSGREISFVNVPASRPARVLEWSHRLLELSASN